MTHSSRGWRRKIKFNQNNDGTTTVQGISILAVLRMKKQHFSQIIFAIGNQIGNKR